MWLLASAWRAVVALSVGVPRDGDNVEHMARSRHLGSLADHILAHIRVQNEAVTFCRCIQMGAQFDDGSYQTLSPYNLRMHVEQLMDHQGTFR